MRLSIYRHRTGLVARWASIACACLAICCGKPQHPVNVVIIGVDTLRRDHLGCYGYRRDTSPNIDDLARQAVLFEDAVTQSPWTLPSFATLFTSLYPTQHGAGVIERGSGHFGSHMSRKFPTLAMILLKHGYSTGAIINGPALAPEFGVDKGFEYYDTRPQLDDRGADVTTADALNWIGSNRDTPFFIFVHYFDPHAPYAPPAPFDTLYDRNYRGRLGRSFDRDAYSRMERHLSLEGNPHTEADWNHIRALYDSEIAYTDRAIGALLAGLEEGGMQENTLIVFLSDHGEEFFDHKGFEHGHTLFDELIKVPLMFMLPGVLPENMRVSQQVRLLDVMPTVLDIVGIKPATRQEGVSLRPLITGKGSRANDKERLLPQDLAFSESMLYGTEKKSVTAYPWKLIYDTASGRKMLFNLAYDPAERRDLSREDPHVRDLLEEVLFKTMFEASESWYVELAGGREGHTFDVTVTVPERLVASGFDLCKIFDSDSRLMDQDDVILNETTRKALRLEDFRVQGTTTLAMKADPEWVPVSFDLLIDGKPAVGRVFLGEDLAEPDGLPFTQSATQGELSKGAPSKRPKPPYVIVWHSGFECRDDTPVTLADDTKQRLKALGYIH